MKKICLLIILSVSGLSTLKAQEIDDVRKYIILKQYQKGKDAVDKFLAKSGNENKADAWYYKAFVYNVLSRDPAQGVPQMISLNKDAFAAFQKYRQLDPKETLTKEEENATVYNVYYGYYDLAVKAYNSKDYQQSFDDFTNALEVHDYIASNKLGGAKGLQLSALDTDVVFNLVILGNELKKSEDVMAGLYKKLVDANVTEDKYLEAYEGLVMYYKKTKNKAAFTEYVEKGKQRFPKDIFWEAIDIEFAVDGLEKEALFKKYDELGAKYPNSYVLFFNYGYELNKYVYSDEPKTGDLAAYKTKIPELFKKAIAIKSTTDANMLLANFYYNNSYDLTEEAKKIKGNKPDEVKKRLDLNAASKNNQNTCIPVAEEAVRLFAAMPKLKLSEKVNYKQAYDMLSTIYRINGDAKKADEYEKKKADVDKL
jgi:hypothetical protein